ncbi:ankyrin repeat and SOCS box protein 13-like [Halyomorpha halys]|uniref:ankyrin repeat and SOCS box protein 13-like n=1 Tax=Halyomorpha halys TaxID=286706 RepID=UPI0006D4FF9C|nr:NF-kappa-B inhibitor alpha-like [Halyomorpha halys]
MNFIEGGYTLLDKLHIKYGANIEKKNINSNLSLSKNMIMVKLILQASKNFKTFIDACSKVDLITPQNKTKAIYKLTALFISSNHGQTEIVGQLISYGPSLEVSNERGYTPLLCACEDGHVKEAHLLLSHLTAALDYSDDYGYTALHYAALSGSQEIVKLLLSLGANEDARTNDLKTPLH